MFRKDYFADLSYGLVLLEQIRQAICCQQTYLECWLRMFCRKLTSWHLLCFKRPLMHDQNIKLRDG